MRTGIFGGTFDPPHIGHLVAMEAARDLLHLDRVRVIPAAVSPHKVEKESSSSADRLTMTQLAFGGNPAIVIDERELHREGPSYMVDTLADLRRECPEDVLFLMIGKDNIAEFAAWREPLRIFELATVVSLDRMLSSSGEGDRVLVRRIQQLNTPRVDVSSTMIRERVRRGLSIRYMVPEAVREFIVRRHLYVD